MSCLYCGNDMALVYVSGPGAEIVEEVCSDKIQVSWRPMWAGLRRAVYRDIGCGAEVRVTRNSAAWTGPRRCPRTDRRPFNGVRL
jgi:hypothetical protein